MGLAAKDFQKWIAVCECPKHRDLFFIGPISKRITFYSQQVRAMCLAHALKQLNRITPDSRIAVIGGGAAGTTASAALASFGCRVVLYERSEFIISPQISSTRLLHPNIYDWPHQGALSDKANLPLMPWSKDTAGKIAQEIGTEFSKIEGTGDFKVLVKKSHAVKSIVPKGTRWTVNAVAGNADLPGQDFDIVILAVGFGEEKKVIGHDVKGYWQRDGVPSGAAQSHTALYFVSGRGDGGLTDLLAVLIRNFDHVSFTTKFLRNIKGSALSEAVFKAESETPAEGDISPAYDRYVRPILDSNGVIDFIRDNLRGDRKVIFNAQGGVVLKKGAAAILNQVMAYALQQACAEGKLVDVSNVDVASVEERAGKKYIKYGGSEYDKGFDVVIIRHGPDRDKNYEFCNPYYGDFKTHYEELRKIEPSIDQPPALHCETWLALHAAADVFFDDANKRIRADHRNRLDNTIILGFDSAREKLFQWGRKGIEEIFSEPQTIFTLQLMGVNVLGDLFEQIIRLFRASQGKLQLSILSTAQAEWPRPDIPRGVFTTPVESPYTSLPAPNLATFSAAIDMHLLNLIDLKIANIIATNRCDIGDIDPTITATMKGIWDQWLAALKASNDLRTHFLATLWQIEKVALKPWDGDQGCLSKLACAVALALAAKSGLQELNPKVAEMCNMVFKSKSNDGDVIASACSSISNRRIGDYINPSDWDADCLILSGTQDLMFPEGNEGVLITEIGGNASSLTVSSRVAPVVIQDDRYWRENLKKNINDWKAAVELEFDKWRNRQDSQLVT